MLVLATIEDALQRQIATVQSDKDLNVTLVAEEAQEARLSPLRQALSRGKLRVGMDSKIRLHFETVDGLQFPEVAKIMEDAIGGEVWSINHKVKELEQFHRLDLERRVRESRGQMAKRMTLEEVLETPQRNVEE